MTNDAMTVMINNTRQMLAAGSIENMLLKEIDFPKRSILFSERNTLKSMFVKVPINPIPPETMLAILVFFNNTIRIALTMASVNGITKRKKDSMRRFCVSIKSGLFKQSFKISTGEKEVYLEKSSPNIYSVIMSVSNVPKEVLMVNLR